MSANIPSHIERMQLERMEQKRLERAAKVAGITYIMYVRSCTCIGAASCTVAIQCLG